MNNGMKYKARIEVSHDVEISFETPLFTGDIGNTIGLEFYLHGKPYKFTMATLFGTDATGDTIYSTSKAEVNEVVLPIVNEMYQVPGKADMQVVLYDDSENAITSAYLHFTVIKGLSENASIEGTEEYNSIMNLLVQVSSSMSQINRAEQAANEIESFLQLIKNPENSVVHQITESEIDDFTHGFAVVSAMESKESEGGPILTEYRYPLLAESEDLFGNVTVFQTRFFKGNWEQRVVGEEWNSLSVDLSDYVTESDLNRKLSSVYKYKGSVETVNDLPSVNEIGDVWNVKHGTVGGESLRLIPFTSIEVDVAGAYVGYYDGAKYPVISSEEEWLNVDLYDEDYNLILTSQNVTIKPEYVFSPPFDSRFLTAKYFQLTDGSNVGEVISPGLQVEAGDNVAWTGSEWDVLAGTIDLSGYVTREELGNIEAALSRIEELQNSYIAGGE